MENYKTFMKQNPFELAAFTLSIASIFSCSVIYCSYVFAGLAILFALLSRGGQMQMSPRSRRSLLIAIAGILLSTVLFVYSFFYLLEEYGSLEAMLQNYCEMYGLDFEEEFGILFQ